MPFVRYTDGPAVHADKPRRQRLTSAQILARRHALWLHAAEVGLPDPVTRRNRPHTADEIASLWSVDRSTIFRGIESARRLQAMGVRDE